MAGESSESHGDLTKSVTVIEKGSGGGYIGGGMASRDLRERHLVEAVFVIGGQVCEGAGVAAAEHPGDRLKCCRASLAFQPGPDSSGIQSPQPASVRNFTNESLFNRHWRHQPISRATTTPLQYRNPLCFTAQCRIEMRLQNG